VTNKRILAPTLAGAIILVLLIQLPFEIASRASEYELFGTIVDIRRVLLDNHVEEPDESAMQEAIIDGMIGVLDDPYTQYIPPVHLDDFNKELRGNYVGIGAEVNLADGFLTIVTPMEDSPALRAGVRAGDVVLEIEGESTFEVPISESIDRLTGEEGTTVTVRVRHLDGTEEDLQIVRSRIVTRTVKGFRRIGEEWNYCVNHDVGIAYIRVTQFNASTVNELAAAIDIAKHDGMTGLILDLRDDPGGGLKSAVDMADLFLDDGTIVSVRPRNGQPETYSARAPGTLDDFPLLVLVNGSSASASEIVAGALQENDRAIVMGMRTYGKGSVQEVRPLPFEGGTLKFTTAYYYLPSGRNLNRRSDSDTWGVDPDPGFVVPEADEAYIDRITARRDFEVIRDAVAGDEDCGAPDWIRENLKDEQLALAVEAIENRILSDKWFPVTEVVADDAVLDISLRHALVRRARLLEELDRTEGEIDRLHTQAETLETETLLPEDVDLTEGTLVVRNAAGEEIGVFTITGGDVELALGTLDLAPAEAMQPFQE
jgi:carboxyl-terminal processing protease